MCITDMLHQQTLCARMDFFEGHVFQGGDNAVPTEITSVAANVPDGGTNIAGIFYNYFILV